MFFPVKWPSFSCATVLFGRKEAMSERALYPHLPILQQAKKRTCLSSPPLFPSSSHHYPHPLQLMWAIVVAWATCFLGNRRDEGRIVRRSRNEKNSFFFALRKGIRDRYIYFWLYLGKNLFLPKFCAKNNLLRFSKEKDECNTKATIHLPTQLRNCLHRTSGKTTKVVTMTVLCQ